MMVQNVKTGDMLGDMTDGLSGKGITNFVSTGLKSYSFKYGNDNENSVIEGFTPNHENSSILNHNSVRKIVKNKLENSQSLTKIGSRERTEKS